MNKNKRTNKSSKLSSNDSAKLLEFLGLIVNLEEVEIIGVVRTIGVQMISEDGVNRDFEDVLSEALDKFIAIPNNQKIELLNLMHSAANGKDKANKKKVN